MKELDFLKIIRKQNSKQNLFDDAAVFDKKYLISKDLLVEKTHFDLKKISWNQLGARAINVNLSDIAAMGGTPKYLLVGLSLNKQVSEKNIKELYQGFKKAAGVFNVEIIGGDITGSKNLNTISITIIGYRSKKILTRHGFKLGDKVYVTGPLGSGAVSKYTNKVVPRIREGEYLANNNIATACIDISDGVARCVHDLTVKSAYEVKIAEEKIPLVKKATLNNALYGGEDYELLFTGKKIAKKMPFRVYEIGEIVKKGQGSHFAGLGYDHF